jgi:hypothetical protein
MTELPTLGWAGVRARRLARHQLASRPSGASSVVDAVRAMCGAHAQILSAAELSIGVRTTGTTRDDVRRALWDDRSLVKARGPRGTIHLLPADDLGWWVTALAAVPGGIVQRPDARLTDDQTAAVLAAVAHAVADAELTMDELSAPPSRSSCSDRCAAATAPRSSARPVASASSSVRRRRSSSDRSPSGPTPDRDVGGTADQAGGASAWRRVSRSRAMGTAVSPPNSPPSTMRAKAMSPW